MKLPSLFISHGSPMMAVEPGTLGPMLEALGRELPAPRAILVLSPHWMSRRVEVQATPQPETVHDFGGFPRRLYECQYPAPGAPAVAAEIITLLRSQGIDAVANDSVGYDHGAWVPLLYLAPAAQVPVLQIAQPASRDWGRLAMAAMGSRANTAGQVSIIAHNRVWAGAWAMAAS